MNSYNNKSRESKKYKYYFVDIDLTLCVDSAPDADKEYIKTGRPVYIGPVICTNLTTNDISDLYVQCPGE